MAPRVQLVGPPQPRSPGLSTPQMLVIGAVLLMGANMFMQRSQPQVTATQAGTLPEAATPRNLALTKLQDQLHERDLRISELQKLKATQATLGTQPLVQAVVASTAPPKEVVWVKQAVAGEEVPPDERVNVPADEVFPDELRRCRKNSDLFISFSSASMSTFALNWVANLRLSGINQFLVGALDAKMLDIATSAGVPSMPLDGSSIARAGAANLRFDYSAYKRMAALKVAFYTRILKMGFNLWACDADTGWMGNPTVFVNEYPMQHVDMLTTTDCIDLKGDQAGGCWHVDHNTGLVYMRSRQVVLDFLVAWKAKIETTRDIMVRDQAALNLLMRENFQSKTWTPPPDPDGKAPVRSIYLTWNNKLKLARLPLKYFANGHSFFVQRMYEKPQAPPPFVVHMTYQYGDSSKFPYGKRQRMREARVWQVDPPDYFTGGKYLAVAPEAAILPIDYLSSTCTTAEAADRFNKEEVHMRRVLRDALALAIALNRTLVLPRMMCYCDNIWKEMKHCRVGGAFDMTLPFDCPADHILNLVNWFDVSLPIEFREPAFLSDPRVPEAIRSSWVRVQVKPMTADEARAALAPLADKRVIELGNAFEVFCGFEQTSLAQQFSDVAKRLVPYSRHFCQEDATPQSCVGPRPGCVPFYAPCCHGAPGRHFPCKYLVPAPGFQFDARNAPEFCAGRQGFADALVSQQPRPTDYPDFSPNPRSRHFHKYVDDFSKNK